MTVKTPTQRSDTDGLTKNYRISIVALATALTLALAIGGATVIATDRIDSADRVIETTELEPGETTMVTITVENDEANDIAVIETPDSAGLTVESVEAKPGPKELAVQDNSNEIVAVWNDVDKLTLQYDVYVQDDAVIGAAYELDGELLLEGETVSVGGDSTVTVVDPADDGDTDEGPSETDDTTDDDATDESDDLTDDEPTTDAVESDDNVGDSDSAGNTEDDATPGFGIALSTLVLLGTVLMASNRRE